MLTNIMKLLDGKKTYIVAFLAAVVALLSACGIEIPEWANMLAIALGLGSLKSATKKAE